MEEPRVDGARNDGANGRRGTDTGQRAEAEGEKKYNWDEIYQNRKSEMNMKMKMKNLADRSESRKSDQVR